MSNYSNMYQASGIPVKAASDVNLRPKESTPDTFASVSKGFDYLGKGMVQYQKVQATEAKAAADLKADKLMAEFQSALIDNTSAMAQGVIDSKTGALNERQIWQDYLAAGVSATDAQKIVNGVSGNVVKAKSDFTRTLEQDWIKDEQDNKRKQAEELKKLNPMLFGDLTLSQTLQLSDEIKRNDDRLVSTVEAHRQNPEDKALAASYNNSATVSAQYNLSLILRQYQKEPSQFGLEDVTYVKNTLAQTLINNGVDSSTASDKATKVMQTMGIGVNQEKLKADYYKNRVSATTEAAKYNIIVDKPELLALESMSPELRNRWYGDPTNWPKVQEFMKSAFNSTLLSPRTDDVSISGAGMVANSLNKNANATEEQKTAANTQMFLNINDRVAKGIDKTPEDKAALNKAIEDALTVGSSKGAPEGIKSTPEFQLSAFNLAKAQVTDLANSLSADNIAFDGTKFVLTKTPQSEKGFVSAITAPAVYENSRVMQKLNKTLSMLDEGGKQALMQTIPKSMWTNTRERRSAAETAGITSIGEDIGNIKKGAGLAVDSVFQAVKELIKPDHNMGTLRKIDEGTLSVANKIVELLVPKSANAQEYIPGDDITMAPEAVVKALTVGEAKADDVTLPPDRTNATDEEDFTEAYNTLLSPEEEKEFNKWMNKEGRAGDLYDYDLRGAWKDNAKETSNGHLPDTYKKPNHPTFSEESKYSKDMPAGKWTVEDGKDVYTAPAGLSTSKKENLKRYFNKVEKDAVLKFEEDDNNTINDIRALQKYIDRVEDSINEGMTPEAKKKTDKILKEARMAIDKLKQA